MDWITERNSKAYENGKRAENIILSRFKNVVRIDRIYDYLIDNDIVEVKSCQEWHKNGSAKCRGRFVLDEEQHQYLVENNGYYLFIVFLESGDTLIKLVKASDITFKRKLCWTYVFDESKSERWS